MRSLYPLVVVSELMMSVTFYTDLLTNETNNISQDLSNVVIRVNITIITILRILHPRIRTLYPHKREIANKIA